MEPPLWGDRGRSEEREIARWAVREGGVVHIPFSEDQSVKLVTPFPSSVQEVGLWERQPTSHLFSIVEPGVMDGGSPFLQVGG